MLTDWQTRLIEKAKKLGYGYAVFAANVERQGWCSPKQAQALSDMVSAGEYRKNNWKPPSGKRRPMGYKHDISDSEAMQSGDYF